jgi:hypothetical protein
MVDLSNFMAPVNLIIEKKKNFKEVADYEYRHIESDEIRRVVVAATTAGAGGGITTLNLGTGEGKYIQPGDTLRTQKNGEYGYVTAVSGDTVTLDNTVAAYRLTTALATDDEIVVIGSSVIEGSGPRRKVSTEPSVIKNFIQTHRQDISITGRADEVASYGDESDWDRMDRQSMEKLNQEKEEMFLFGKKAEGMVFSGTDTVRTSAGLYNIITSNVSDASAGFTRTTWNQWVRDCTQRNYDQLKDCVIYAGDNVMEYLQMWGEDVLYENTGTDKLFGIHYGRVVTQFTRGEGIPIIRHGLLTRHMTSTKGELGGNVGLAFFINTNHIGMAHWRNRKMIEAEYDGIDVTGYDLRAKAFLCDVGTWLPKEISHGLLKNVPDITG